MLFLCLAISASLVLGVTLAARRGGLAVLLVTSVGLLAAVFGPPLLVERFLPAAALNAVALAAALALGLRWAGRWADGRPRRVFALSVAATVAAYLVFVPAALRRQAEVGHLLAEFPFESMDGRAPVVPPDAPPPACDPDRLRRWEREVGDGRWTYIQIDRARGLERLHEHAVHEFVDSWGFGFQRMPPLTEDDFARLKRTGPTPPQPAARPGNSSASLPGPTGELDRLHTNGVRDFLQPERFGLVRGRGRVAGFEPHGFTAVPVGEERHGEGEWEVARLELVGLLTHPDSVVYASDRLPQMDALKGVPTRPLDAFEAGGLTELRAGADLKVEGDRMLGAIRSVRRCVACHGGEPGHLLGAFSYVLRPRGGER